MAAVFLSHQEYSLKLNDTLRGLGTQATVEAAREYLDKSGIYKDTAENRKKYDKEKK